MRNSECVCVCVFTSVWKCLQKGEPSGAEVGDHTSVSDSDCAVSLKGMTEIVFGTSR